MLNFIIMMRKRSKSVKKLNKIELIYSPNHNIFRWTWKIGTASCDIDECDPIESYLTYDEFAHYANYKQFIVLEII